MDTQLNKDQERMLLLQEKCYFAELSVEEQAFVLDHSSEEVFDKAHRVIMESKELYSVPVPRPLVLPIAAPSKLRLILLPISSAAAAAVITFLFFRKESIVIETVEKPVYMAADTVYLHDKEIDTVLEYRTIYKQLQEERAASSAPVVELSKPSQNNEELPPINNIDLKNRGVSAKDDKTVALMEGVVF